MEKLWFFLRYIILTPPIVWSVPEEFLLDNFSGARRGHFWVSFLLSPTSVLLPSFPYPHLKLIIEFSDLELTRTPFLFVGFLTEIILQVPGKSFPPTRPRLIRHKKLMSLSGVPPLLLQLGKYPVIWFNANISSFSPSNPTYWFQNTLISLFATRPPSMCCTNANINTTYFEYHTYK